NDASRFPREVGLSELKQDITRQAHLLGLTIDRGRNACQRLRSRLDREARGILCPIAVILTRHLVMDGGHRDLGELILSIKRKGLVLADGNVSNRLMPLTGNNIDLIRIRCREINKHQLYLIRLLRISGALRRYLRTDAR